MRAFTCGALAGHQTTEKKNDIVEPDTDASIGGSTNNVSVNVMVSRAIERLSGYLLGRSGANLDAQALSSASKLVAMK